MPKGGRHGLPVHGGRGREHARTHTHTHTHTLTHTGVFFFSSSIVVAVDGSHPGQNRGPPIRAAQLLVFKRKEGEGGAKLSPPARVQAVGEALVMGRGACAPPAVAASTHHDGDDAPAVGREGDECPGHLPVELFCVSMSPLRTTQAHLWMEIGRRRVAKLAAVALHKEVAWLDPAAPPPPHEPLNEVGSRVAGAPLPPLWGSVDPHGRGRRVGLDAPEQQQGCIQADWRHHAHAVNRKEVVANAQSRPGLDNRGWGAFLSLSSPHSNDRRGTTRLQRPRRTTQSTSVPLTEHPRLAA